MAIDHKPVSVAQLRTRCDPGSLGLQSTDEIETVDSLIKLNTSIVSIIEFSINRLLATSYFKTTYHMKPLFRGADKSLAMIFTSA